MSERLRNTIDYEDDVCRNVREVGVRALALAQNRYCSGFPLYQGGQIQKLGYNNARHDFMVGNDSARLGEAVGFGATEQTLLRTTGYAHDLVQLTGRGNDERASAEWIEKQLRDSTALPPVMATMASRAILATEPLFKNGAVAGQRVDEMEFDSRHEERFARTVVASDLGELYTPMGPYLSRQLYMQRQGVAPHEAPDTADFTDFHTRQIGFLESYHYTLPEAEGVLASHRREVITYAHALYEQLQRGDITSWQQLLAQDLAFMHNPAALLDSMQNKVLYA